MVAQGQRTLTDLFDFVRNLLDSSKWVVGSSGSQPGFTRYGLTENNSIELGIDPFGRMNPLWKYLDTDAAATTTDGGFTTDFVTVNAASTYRYVLFLKRSSATDGISYLGMYSNGSVHVLTLAGADNTNPYFWNGDLPVANRWYAIVAYIHGQDSTVSTSIGGVYDMVTGVKVASCTDFKWKAGTTQAKMRTHLLSSAVLNNAAWAWNPIIELCDGGEQPIETLFAGKASDYQLSQMASDSLITPQEKTLVLGRWCEIVNDVARTTAIPSAYNGTIADGRYKTLRDRAYGLGIWTPTTASTAAKNFFDATEGLRAYLFGSPGVLLTASWSTNITITRTTWLTLWMTFESTADALQTAITSASQAQSIVFLTSLATAGNYTGQLGVYRGQIYRWTGTAWESKDASLPLDPAVYLALDDSAAIDNSGNRRHVTLSGAFYVQGIAGNALSFDGVDDYGYGTYPDSTAFTLACLIKRTGTGTTQDVFYLNRSDVGGRLLIRISSLVIWAIGVDTGGTSRTIVGPASTTEWTAIAVTHDGTTMKLYVDGVLAGSMVCSLSASYYNRLTLGCNGTGNGNYFSGLIDEAAVFTRALTESEILGIYLAKSLQKKYTWADYQLDLMADDSVITKTEKIAKIPDWCSIINDGAMTGTVPAAFDRTVAPGRFKSLRDSAYSAGVWDVATAGTPAKNFYDSVEALRSYLFQTPGVFLLATWETPVPIVPETWRNLWGAVATSADALQSRISEARPHNYLGRYETNHPSPRNNGDCWLIFSPAPMRGIYVDVMGIPTLIDPATTDQVLLSKRRLAMHDVAWAEANGYGISDDYGFDQVFRDIAILRAVVDSLMAEDLLILGQLRSGGYLPDGSNPTGSSGIFISQDGRLRARGAIFETIEALDGIFKGSLDTPLLKTSKAISQQTLATPSKTHWSMTGFFNLFTCAAGNTYDTTGTYNGQTINKLGKFTTLCNVKNGSTTIDSIGVFDFRNYSFSIIEPGTSTTRESSSILAYFQGSAWISAFQAANLPMGVDITVNNSPFAGKTIIKFNYSPTQIILTGSSGQGTITIDATGFYDYTGTLAVADQGASKLLIQGIAEASIGTILAELHDYTLQNGYVKLADGTLICYGTYETNNTTITFKHSFSSLQYAFVSSFIATNNYVFSAQITSRSVSQVSINKRYSSGSAGEPITYIAIGRWK